MRVHACADVVLMPAAGSQILARFNLRLVNRETNLAWNLAAPLATPRLRAHSAPCPGCASCTRAGYAPAAFLLPGWLPGASYQPGPVETKVVSSPGKLAFKRMKSWLKCTCAPHSATELRLHVRNNTCMQIKYHMAQQLWCMMGVTRVLHVHGY